MKNIRQLLALALIAALMLQCKAPGLLRENNGPSQQALAEAGQHAHCGQADPQYVTRQVTVTGDVVHPLVLTVDSLRKMEVTTLRELKIVCQTGMARDSAQTTLGVRLKDILEKATIDQQGHQDRNFYIVARASDNYKATFSWAELFNNPAGEQVYVLFEQDGKPLKEKGEMILVSLSDTRTGPRHVKWLKSIEAQRIK